MGKIIRDPERFAKRTYDLIIIGGGIYGVMLSFEASKRGLKSLLLERADFGGATTFNCLRMLHGGFRYLQTMDLLRFRESVSERRWFLKNFPALAKPLPFLMPLYGNGLKRPSILRFATLVNDILSYNRNDGVEKKSNIPGCKVIDAQQAQSIFHQVDERGLRGGVIWYDAYMPDSQVLVMEILRLACEKGARALNYVEVRQLMKNGKEVCAVAAVDLENGRPHEFKSNIIINAAGPWCRLLAASFDKDFPKLFKSSLAWNLLLDKTPPSSFALAVTPKKARARTYFLLPYKGKLLAGTGHATWHKGPDQAVPSKKMILEFLTDLNLAIPSLSAGEGDILRVFSGLLPAKKEGSTELAVRERFIDHSHHGGPCGLYSISGVKFTTSRLVAEKTLKRILPGITFHENKARNEFTLPLIETRPGRIFDFDWLPSPEDGEWKEHFRSILKDESVQHLDDLIFRRTSLWENCDRLRTITPLICELFEWEKSKQQKESMRIQNVTIESP